MCLGLSPQEAAPDLLRLLLERPEVKDHVQKRQGEMDHFIVCPAVREVSVGIHL